MLLQAWAYISYMVCGTVIFEIKRNGQPVMTKVLTFPISHNKMKHYNNVLDQFNLLI